MQRNMYCPHRRPNASDNDINIDEADIGNGNGKATPIATLLRETATIANAHIQQIARDSRPPKDDDGGDTNDIGPPRPDGVGIRLLHHQHHQRQHHPNNKPLGQHPTSTKRHQRIHQHNVQQHSQRKHPSTTTTTTTTTSAVAVATAAAGGRPIMNRQEYHERLAVAEALSRTSMMTSPAARRRLAARKVEFDMMGGVDEGYWDDDFDYVPPKQLLLYMVR